MAKYCVIRTDLMSGTKQPADLLSVRVYDSNGNPIAVENGVIVKIGDLETGEREVYKATIATSEDSLDDCAILAGVEVNYDEHKRSLDDYINEAGKAVRAYIPRNRNMFSLTAAGFNGTTAPVKGDKLVIGTNGKLAITSGNTYIGKVIAVEQAGRFTFYVIKICK